jgi:hypothetical protein
MHNVKMSLQWRLTCIITVYIAVICGCLTMLVYKNGVYYIDSLKETVDARGDENADDTDDTDEIYISIPEDNWDAFANDFSVQVYNNKADYRKNSLKTEENHPPDRHYRSCDAPPVSSGVQPAAPSSLPSPLQGASQS